MNAIAQTSNFGLYVTDDNTESFRTWRESMNAISGSNMTIIDEELAKRSETYYCTCATAAGTSVKVISSANANFALKTGAVVNVEFTNGNTASTVQLNIDSTGAKSARPVTGEASFSDQWEAGQVISFVYDGTYWIYCGGGAGGNSTYYGECSTAAATQAKIVTITGFPTTLKAGLSIRIKFTNAQTYSGAPTLNVSSTGAKTIRYLSDTNSMQYQWSAGEVLDFVYDGTYWVEVNGGIATATYYGATKLSSSTSSTSTSLAATPAAVKAAYDLANGRQAAITANGVLKGDGNGNISAAVAGTDYQTPLVAGTDYARPSDIPTTASSVGAAPTSHASTATTYGAGTSSNYGHVKLSDSTSSTSSAAGGIAATPAAVKAAYDLANGKQASIKTSTITTTTTWSGSGPYTQSVTISGYTVTANTKVDIQPTAAQIAQLITDGVTSLLVSNGNGTLTMYATGAAPTTAMTIQATCMEVTAA